MWDKRIQAKGKVRQGNQAKKAKAKGKEFLSTVRAFSDRIGLPPAVTGWAASCDGGP